MYQSSGVSDLKLSQVDTLLKKGVAMSSKFKTASKFLLQPVPIPDISKPLLSIYLEVLRPIAASRNKNILQFDEPLWIGFYDGCEVDVGRLVQSYFKRRLCINISTTNIRSLVETETDKMFRNGKISQDERESISFINGHNSQTTKDYYVRENMTHNVCQAKKVFSNISNDIEYHDENIQYQNDNSALEYDNNQSQVENQIEISPIISSETNNRSSRSLIVGNQNAEPAEYTARVWGENHPEFGRKEGPGERAQWSQEEKNYLIPLATRLSLISKTNLMARCLKHIKSDSSATAIFHKRHVLTSDRLKSCWVTYQKSQNELTLDE
jgi:hypothetical protein